MLSLRPHSSLLALLFLVSCGETVAPPESSRSLEGDPGLAAHKGGHGHRIRLRDRCGGDSWIAFGGCLIDGKVERPEWSRA